MGLLLINKFHNWLMAYYIALLIYKLQLVQFE